MGIRANDPSSTGTATRSAVCVASKWNMSRKRGAKALITPQAAKQRANEEVARARLRPGLGEDGVLTGCLKWRAKDSGWCCDATSQTVKRFAFNLSLIH